METERIPIFNRKGDVIAHALVDAADAETVRATRWALHNSGTRAYALHWVAGAAPISMHRLILQPADGLQVDHINGDGLDNRRENLRSATHAENMQNRPSHKGATSHFRAVHWAKHVRKWRARVRLDGHYVHLGYFVNEAEAAKAAADWRAANMPFAVETRHPVAV